MMLNDFLFEIGTEELPSAAVLSLSTALKENMLAALTKAEIGFEAIKVFATPRRIGLYISQLAGKRPAQKQQRRGPALGAAYDAEGKATQALLGFAKSCQVDVAELSILKTDKGSWVVHEVLQADIKTQDLLPALIKEALRALPIKKPMRWGRGEAEFVRPVHWIVMLWGDAVLPFEMFDLVAGRKTYGHRFHAPEAFELPHPKDYEALLKEAYVLADFNTRRDTIIQQIENLAKTKEAEALMPSALLDEVSSIVEWPEAVLANFDPAFLDVPQEALIASMQAHQKCFALQDKNKQLLPFFVAVSNIQSADPAALIKGNEKVMRARLSDAAFFFAQDKKTSLIDAIAGTSQVIFQAKLGSLQDKASRVQKLMATIASSLGIDKSCAERAALLSKCDLVSGMVGEFPELQGVMGHYYALHDGEAPEVASALRDQYLPRFSGDSLPKAPLSQALSMADRLDTLVGIFGLGQKPSGDKDPFKLRRHALALARLLMINPKLRSLSELIHLSFEALKPSLTANASLEIAELKPFILERLQSYYQAEGISQDTFLAVKACQSDWLFDLDKRVRALKAFVAKPQAKSLASACKRVSNLLEQEKTLAPECKQVDEELLSDGAEKKLFAHLLSLEKTLAPLYEQGDYPAIFEQLASLKEPVDEFFSEVMVMVEDRKTKNNRLALLAALNHLLQEPADIAMLSAI